MENKSFGYICVFRSIKNHWIWKNPEKLKWWLDILLSVNYSIEIQKINIGNKLYECGRAQSIKSLSNWANEWGVSKDTARNFISLLVKDGMISLENLTKTTRITVCNYDSYQVVLHDEQTQTKRKPNANRNKQEGKEGKEGKEINYDFIQNLKMKEIFLKWIEYKKTERKETYKNQNTIETCFNKLNEYSHGIPEIAQKIIEKSIISNWSGFFELKKEPELNNLPEFKPRG